MAEKKLPELGGFAVALGDQLETFGFHQVANELGGLSSDYMRQLEDSGIDFDDVSPNLEQDVVGWRSDKLGMAIITDDIAHYKQVGEDKFPVV